MYTFDWTNLVKTHQCALLYIQDYGPLLGTISYINNLQIILFKKQISRRFMAQLLP